MNLQITTDSNKSINTLLNQVTDLVEHIPFWNSDFQNTNVVVNWEMSPHRWYRHASLRIMNRLNALNECYYWMRENESKIKRLNREIDRLEKNKPEDYDLDIEDKIIEIEKIESWYSYTEKLIKDANQEIKSLTPILQAQWKMTRETFESMEKEHLLNIHKQCLAWVTESEKSLIAIESKMYDDLINNNKLLW